MDGDENFSIYAFNSQTANFYPVSEITSNDQKYYIMSLGACENIPDGLTMEEMQIIQFSMQLIKMAAEIIIDIRQQGNWLSGKIHRQMKKLQANLIFSN